MKAECHTTWRRQVPAFLLLCSFPIVYGCFVPAVRFLILFLFRIINNTAVFLLLDLYLHTQEIQVRDREGEKGSDVAFLRS